MPASLSRKRSTTEPAANNPGLMVDLIDSSNKVYDTEAVNSDGELLIIPQQGSLDLTNLVQEAYLAAVQATNKSGATAHPVVTMLPMPLFFGEGAPLYAGGLGTVSLCPVPSYLLQAGSRTNPKLLNLDKLDKRLIYGQILTFARTISALDATDF